MPDNAPALAEIQTWLTSRIIAYGELAPDSFTIDTPLDELGFNSVYALTLCGDIEDAYSVDVEPTIVWDHPTIRELSAALTEMVGPT